MSGIVDIARRTTLFATWLDVVEAAGLSETLETKGPYTVFMPTDQAFKKLSPATLNNLLTNAQSLKWMVADHVCIGKATSDEAVDKKKLTAVSGRDLHVQISSDGIHVAGARVVEADMCASNGIIHAVDTVLSVVGQ